MGWGGNGPGWPLRSSARPPLLDAEDILKIPLCTRKVADFWAWQEEARGMFSVCSAYHMILRTKHEREAWLNEEEGTSIVQQEADKWSNIWHLQVPSKLRMFVWRLARNYMPTIDLLKHRNMVTEDNCPLCGAVDTWRHALLCVRCQAAFGP